MSPPVPWFRTRRSTHHVSRRRCERYMLRRDPPELSPWEQRLNSEVGLSRPFGWNPDWLFRKLQTSLALRQLRPWSKHRTDGSNVQRLVMLKIWWASHFCVDGSGSSRIAEGSPQSVADSWRRNPDSRGLEPFDYSAVNRQCKVAFLMGLGRRMGHRRLSSCWRSMLPGGFGSSTIMGPWSIET